MVSPMPARQPAGRLVREATAARWRIRETHYRALAADPEHEAAKAAWSMITDRCAELADYLERT
jgi:hypothetical protein